MICRVCGGPAEIKFRGNKVGNNFFCSSDCKNIFKASHCGCGNDLVPGRIRCAQCLEKDRICWHKRKPRKLKAQKIPDSGQTSVH